MKFFSSLAPIADQYEGILLDLWGCLHDGSHLYPGALECLQQLRKRNKKIVLLSNAPRRSAKAQAVLDQLGVERSLYDGLLTSGEAGFQMMQKCRDTEMQNFLHFCTSAALYFYIGPDRDADVLHGLPYSAAPHIKDADFILNVGFGSEAHSMDEWDAVLREAAQRALPMLCLNPDMEVVKISGERFPCAGVIAKEYEKLGGRVTYIGKPYGQVYALALDMLQCNKGEVLAIGDGLHTDISGAKNAGLASALVTGGILKQQLGNIAEAELRAHLAAQDVQADYVLPGLVW